MTIPRTALVRLNRLRAGVGRFLFCLYKWGSGYASSAACECGAEEQTVDHVFLQCRSIDLPMDCTAWRFWTMRQSRMAAQHLPRDLVRPSSSYEELT